MTDVDATRVPMLAALSARDRAEVLRNARQRTWPAGEVVVREGDSALNLFVILDGEARVERAAGGPNATLRSGDFFGELGVITQHARTASVIATTPLTCLMLPAWEFRALLAAHPEMAVPMVHALIARLHGMSSHDH